MFSYVFVTFVHMGYRVMVSPRLAVNALFARGRHYIMLKRCRCIIVWTTRREEYTSYGSK